LFSDKISAALCSSLSFYAWIQKGCFVSEVLQIHLSTLESRIIPLFVVSYRMTGVVCS
jgi:hypothetical protein